MNTEFLYTGKLTASIKFQLKGYGNIFPYDFILKNFQNYMLISFTDFA